MPAPDFHVAVGAHEQYAIGVRVPGKVLQEVEARFVRPMQVVDEEGDGPDGGGVTYETAHRPQELLQLFLALRGGRGGLRWEVIRQQPLQVRPACPLGSLLVERTQGLQEGVECHAALRLVAASAGHVKAPLPGLYAAPRGKALFPYPPPPAQDPQPARSGLAPNRLQRA